MIKVETRTINCELRTGAALGGNSQGDEMNLVGIAITYGALSAPIGGQFRERVQRGAFAKSLASGHKVIADWNHQEQALPLGTTDAGTLKLKDGPEGLDFRIALDPNQSAHRDLYSSVKRGDTQHMSWAFNVDGDDGEDWDTDKDEEGRSFNRRTVKRAILHGISVVNRPSYPGDATSVQARSLATSRNRFGLRPGQSLESRYKEITGREYRQPRIALNQDALLRARLAKIDADLRMESFALASAVRPVYEPGRDLPVRFEVVEMDTSAVNRRQAELRKERQAIYDADWGRRVVVAQSPHTAEDDELRARLKRAGYALSVESNSEDGGQVSDPQQLLRCRGGSMTSSADEHRLASEQHCNRARRCSDLGLASAHYAAQDAHRQAAENLTQETASAALRACRSAWGSK